jgi:molecular chaperone DnaK
VEIRVIQGERPMAVDNKLLGNFILDGVPPAPRGIPQIEVAFDIDANGILNVSAQDKATGREQHITVTASSGLSKEEVERMVKESEQHAAEDRQRKERVEARNTADSMIYQAEKILREQGDKVPANVKSDVESKISSLRTILDSGSTDELENKAQDLGMALQQIGAAMYEQPQPTTPPPGEEGGPPPPGEGGDEDIIEGEFKEA